MCLRVRVCVCACMCVYVCACGLVCDSECVYVLYIVHVHYVNIIIGVSNYTANALYTYV